MAYNKKTWVSNETITDEALNNIENGIATLDINIKNLVDSISLGVHTDGLIYLFINGTPTGNGISIENVTLGSTNGYVSNDKTFMIPDNLANGTYTLKYKCDDGSYIAIGEFEITEEVK